MTTSQTGTAPAPNAQPTAAASAPPAKKPDLDDFLREFDTATPPAKPAAPAASSAAAPAQNPGGAPAAPAIDPDTVNRVLGAAQRIEQRESQAEIDHVVDTIKGSSEFLKSVDPEVVYGFLQGLGARDIRFRTAFMQRAQKPDVWANVLGAVATKLEEKLRPVASAPSAESRAAVLAAARVSSKAPPTEPVDPAALRAMSDSQFRAFKRQQAALARR